MRSFFSFLSIILLLTGCYSAPDIKGFDSEKWANDPQTCEGYRLKSAREILENENSTENLLGSNQNEVKALFGDPEKHQLFNRNQKFFFYELDCSNEKQLSIRFDALGRVKELQIIEI